MKPSKTQVLKHLWNDHEVKEVAYVSAYILFHLVLGQVWAGFATAPETSFFVQGLIGVAISGGTFIALTLLLILAGFLYFEKFQPAYQKAREKAARELERSETEKQKQVEEEAKQEKINQIYKEAHEAFSERDLKDPEIKRPGPTHLIID